MSESAVKFPLRPTLLVITSDKTYEAQSLAERAARTFSGDMQRLTEKFSRRHWIIGVSDIGNDDVIKTAWASLESSNMAIITGYRGASGESEKLSKIIQAARPIVTLINLGPGLEQADLRLFDKAVSLLPQGLEEQFAMTRRILKETRHENCWGEWDPQRGSDSIMPPPQPSRSIN